MRIKHLAVAALALASSGVGAAACRAQPTPRPTLIVMVSVDQMRADLLTRFAPAYTGGLRLLLDRGMRFDNATHDHAVTHTAAGHASLSTASFPMHSGIVANGWLEKREGKWVSVYAVEDRASPIIGFPELPGRSPANLKRTGLADWVLAADPEARVVSLSGKDRAAITMAGKSRGEVYWLNARLGRFITSEYYRGDYPGWVVRFNEDVMPRILADSVWESTVPLDQRRLARPDAASYEGDGVHTTFPHLAAQEVAPGGGQAAFNAWALRSPRADQAVLQLAEVAVRATSLGMRGHTDYLALSLSSTDYVGHAFGPLSQEQLDNLVRLDRELGEFFAFLDGAVGRGRWIVGFSADHGVLTMPEYLAEQGDTLARRVNSGVMRQQVLQAVQQATSAEGDSATEARRVAEALRASGLVAAAYTHEALLAGEAPDTFAVLFRHSYYPGRGPGWLSRFGVEIRFPEETLVAGATGTSHGSPYLYDRHVPFVVMGSGVEAGQRLEAVRSVDLAPTLASLAGIPVPDDVDGRPVNR